MAAYGDLKTFHPALNSTFVLVDIFKLKKNEIFNYNEGKALELVCSLCAEIKLV